MNTDDLLNERNKTHGEFWLNARIMEQLVDVLRSSPHWLSIPYETRNAMTMTCTKMCRLVSKNGYAHLDNYHDIMGYMTLALEAEQSRQQFTKELEKEGHYD